MAAARTVGSRGGPSSAPSAVYDFVAPSLSSAHQSASSVSDPYSPLVPFAATNTAQLVSRAMAPIGNANVSVGLRSVLSTMLDRSAQSTAPIASRVSAFAPELVTPPFARAEHVADDYAQQRARIADLQRIARAAAERELAAREAPRETRAESPLADHPAAEARAIELRQAEQAQRNAQQLHAESRDAAARDARNAPLPAAAPVSTPSDDRAASELAAAVAALPPELASMIIAGIGGRPDRAAQAIAELGEALRAVELMARTTAGGGSIEPTRGPRLVMPAGLGGLVSTIGSTTGSPAARVPSMGFLDASAATTALGATINANPAALQHVAWSDRWLARFAGATTQSLDLLSAMSATPEMRLDMLAASAPGTVFVAPFSDEALPTLRNAQPSQAVTRFADDAETPDEVFTAIARSRASAVAPAPQPAPAAPASERETLADVLAHSAPTAPGAGLSAQLASSPFAPALRHVMPVGSAPTFDVRALFGSGIGATYLAGLLSASTDELTVEDNARGVRDWQATYVAPQRDDADLTTMRSALLSSNEPTAADARMSASTTAARSMVDSIAMPMLSDAAAWRDVDGNALPLSYASPGMIADRAQAWSVAQERSSADLAFDFVTPELVLAARVYGLGPAEAAQASRLAVAGPGQLTAMAGAVDRTFAQALSIESERRGRTPNDRADADTSVATPSNSAFGVERRAPRGAFLWPAATTAALGLNAASPDGELSMSVAALELLAAQSVAEVGTYAAFGAREDASQEPETDAPASAESASAESAESMVVSTRRDKFEALYVALGQSPTGKSGSPAARAARALALAGRGDESISARERASVAWDVLPMVYGASDESLSTGDAAVRADRRRDELRSATREDQVSVDSRPGLSSLSARAGEALGSYVTPANQTHAASGGASGGASSQSSSSRSNEAGAVMRAPTAAQELVQTGRPAGRHGGGEVEIPVWFEAAARKMLEERNTVSDGISMAELTMVQAAAPQQIAASSRHDGGSTTSVTPAPSAGAGAEKEKIDIEKLANDVYREVLVLMDIARERNGEPYL